MVAIKAERLRELTPTGYINRDLATKLLASHYDDDKLDFHVGRLWGGLANAARRGQLPMNGFCVLCSRHVSSSRKFASHKWCGIESNRTYDTFVFEIDSLYDNAQLILDGPPLKSIGSAVKLTYCQLTLAIENVRTLKAS